MQQVETTPDILASQEDKHWNDILAKEKEIENLNDQVKQKGEQIESLEKQLDALEQKAHQNNTVQVVRFPGVFYKRLFSCLNPFHATGLFRYPQQTSENQRYSDVRGFLMFLGGIERDQWHEMG